MKKTLCIGLILFLLVGCSHQSESNDNAHVHTEKSVYQAENGDLREITQGTQALPSFAQQDPYIQQVYQLVGENHQLLDHIPCYCGCGDKAIGHQSNRSCFIHTIKNHGEVVWDAHGVTCQVCLDIALQAVTLKKQGKGVSEIRALIDRYYQQGFPPPTPTPHLDS